ncbi:MAG: hypothetical protein E7594_05115 [Ruminococcaceae bacterium]|nr:hypothetical protein [Oscillospiraceae bacterium]
MIQNIKCNVKKAIVIIFFGVIMLAICFFFAVCNFRQYVDVPLFNNDVMYYLIKSLMAFSFVFLGFGIANIVKFVVFYRDKLIEFKEDHFVDRSSYTCGGKIQYAEIEEVYVKGEFLCIRLNDADQFLNNQNWLKRLLMRANKKMGYEYITISDQFLDTDLYEIKKILKENISR